MHAIISSKLDYCNSILYGVKSSTLHKLQSVQNEAARIVLSMPAGAIVSDEIFVDLHWLKVEEKIVFQLLLFVHKFFVDNTPSYFAELLLVRDYSKRLLYCCFMNTVPGRRAFFYATPRLWNELPGSCAPSRQHWKIQKHDKNCIIQEH